MTPRELLETEEKQQKPQAAGRQLTDADRLVCTPCQALRRRRCGEQSRRRSSGLWIRGIGQSEDLCLDHPKRRGFAGPGTEGLMTRSN